MGGTGDVELEVGQDMSQPALAEVAKNERRSVLALGRQTLVTYVARLVVSDLDVSRRRGAYTTVMKSWLNSIGR